MQVLAACGGGKPCITLIRAMHHLSLYIIQHVCSVNNKIHNVCKLHCMAMLAMTASVKTMMMEGGWVGGSGCGGSGGDGGGGSGGGGGGDKQYTLNNGDIGVGARGGD